MTTQGFLQGLPEEVVDGFIDSILGWGLYNDAEKEESMTNKRERKEASVGSADASSDGYLRAREYDVRRICEGRARLFRIFKITFKVLAFILKTTELH